jgi:prophage DNA circulation protein
MSWKDNLRPASFRGVAFKVEGHDAEYGRRQATHEYPQRDEPFTEDLGKKARTYSVEAYVLGDDYMATRDQLIAAVETAGPGELVHPYLGQLQVECRGLKIRETATEGRMCRLSLTFVEAGQAKYPSATNDTVSAIGGAANKAKAAAKLGFVEKFLADGFPSFVVNGAAEHLQGISATLARLPFNPVAEAQAVAAFFDQVESLADDALDLIMAPADLADRIVGMLDGVREVFGGKADAALRAIRTGNPSTPTAVAFLQTPNRVQEDGNREALRGLVRAVCIAEQAKVAATTATTAPGDQGGAASFQTREEALAVRDELLEAIDAECEIESTTTDEYRGLVDLRAELVRGVPSPDLRLPRQAEYTPRSTLPSLVVAHQFYGDAGRAVEIAERNRVAHPGFIPGGTPLQVVTDG